MKKRNLLVVALGICLFKLINAQALLPKYIELSDDNWTLWLDKEATFVDDSLYLSTTSLNQIPSNKPTIGWVELGKNAIAWPEVQNKEYEKTEAIPPIQVSVPGTVEEYLWNTNKGDYEGVSWWIKEFQVSQEFEGKSIKIHFRQGARMRCEVYVNQKLVHYNLVSMLPFEADITSAINLGETNQLAVRITDATGNFGWADIRPHFWGKDPIPPSHGFGGIMGKVELEIHNPVRINSVFVMNKPAIKDIETRLEIENNLGKTQKGFLRYQISEAKNPSNILYRQTQTTTLEIGRNKLKQFINVPDAKKWDLDNPNLYMLEVEVLDKQKNVVAYASERFGFRWFEVDKSSGKAMFRLNGKRIVLRTAISWGYYPVNGMYATREMAYKHVQAAKDIGLNMLSFHRGMGQENVLDAADELGILYYAEPGGYTSGRKQRHGANDFTRDWVSEKWLRMVKAMRNHPSLVIYNMINEQADDPDERNHLDMKLAHKIDPSRPMTYVSGWVTEGVEEPQKLHMLPFDTTQYHYGWFDFHHARGWGSLQDLHYRTPSTFFLNSTDEEEIVFYGEEGAIAVPPLLEKAVQHYNQTGKDGWDGAAYKTWLQAYKDYFNKKGWFTYYPTIDGLIEQMGELSHYYQGRIIENVRISNVIDGYAVNGYECERNENHSGVVDVFRNPKTDPDLMSYYAQTLYIALKARNKIEQAGENAIIDAFAVNELDLQGKHTLKISFSTPQGSIENLGEFHVELSGGDVFGELIQEAIDIPLKYGAGRYNVFAELLDENNKVRATGKEDIFVVDVKGEIPDNGAVIDIAGLTNGFLKDLPVYNAEAGKLDYLLLAQGTEEYSEIPSEILQTVDGKTGGVMLEIYKDEKQKELGQTLFSPRIRYDEMTYPFKEALNLKPELSIRFVGYLTPEITGTYQLEISHNWVTRLLINDEKVMEGKNSVAGGKDGAKPVDYYFEAGKKYKVELISEKPFGRPFTHAAFKWKVPQKAYDIEELLKRVENDGTNLVVIHSPESVLKALAGKGTIKYNGNLYHDHSWKGGIYFNKPHDIFKDLPQNVPFNWEYQVFTRYFGPRHRSFLLEGEEAIVASVAGHQHKVGTALGVIEYGKGKVIFSTLDIAPHLNSEETPALVAKKLLINLLRYASKR